MDDEKIVITKEGIPVDCDVLFTFDCEDNLKSYVGYTDHSIAEDGRKNIYVSSFSPFQNEWKLEDVTDPKELDMINDVLQQFDKSVSE